MNTNDKIELPPLPTPDADHYDSGTFAPVWKKGKMEAYARAAIEADRKRIEALDNVVRSSRSVDQLKEALQDRSQRFTASYSEVKNLIGFYEAALQCRGEQRVIGRIKLDGNRHPRAELSTGYDENGDQWKEGTPIYAAPQPAEPVKVPTKWSGWACQYPGKMPRLYGDKSIAMLNHHPEEGDRLLYLVEQSNPIPEPVNPPTREQIREVFLANGFTIKPGQDDLKEYVYEAARALLERYRQCS